MKNCFVITWLTFILLPSINQAQTRQLIDGPEGKLWVITGNKLNIYDPATETLDNQSADYLKRLSLPDAPISTVTKDKHGRYWLAYQQYGLYFYDPAQKRTVRLLSGANDITGITETSSGEIWLAYNNGSLKKIDIPDFDPANAYSFWKSSVVYILVGILLLVALGIVIGMVRANTDRKKILLQTAALTKESNAGLINIPQEPPSAGTENILFHDANDKKYTVLLTEDNDDFRLYLKNHLRFQFNIIEASNGREGWQKTLRQHPDLVVSDIMMPEMTGIDLCKKIKDDQRTNHIPVILVTGLPTDQIQIEGYSTGASDFITKPINPQIFLSRIKNLLLLNEQMKEAFQRHIEVHADKINIISEDEKFIYEAHETVRKNMDNHNFSVEDLGRELFMSRAALYKKMTALTGVTPAEFIRSIRLKHAAQLLQKSRMTVAEIAYEVGYNNPRYFVKYFKEEFHMLPTAYRAANTTK